MSPKVVALISSGRYRQEHYEDVAQVLKDHILKRDSNIRTRTSVGRTITCIAFDFANLFAADNPSASYCGYCGVDGSKTSSLLCLERGLDRMHSYVGHEGFNREKFLTACGLATEPEGTHLPSDILGREY